MTAQPKKLIEVALPLPEINDASAYDTMPGIGAHPKGIHLWWGRKPLPSARAVLFASVVDDPSSHPDKFPTEDAQIAERERLFDILRNLMQKKSHAKPEIYAKAHDEMLKHCGGKLPPLLDPFAGSGAIPLEAARLGFVSHAADLNPVAVLLNKCNLELVPRWLGQKPINPKMHNDVLKSQIVKSGAWGLAADMRYYGDLIRSRAIEKIGVSYPKIALLKENGGRDANIIAWLWARTVASPNPVTSGAHVPLVSTYWLSSKKGGERWLKPIIDTKAYTYHFEIGTGLPSNRAQTSAGTQIGRTGFRCIFTDTIIPFDYIRQEAINGRMQCKMIAVVAETQYGRVYLPANDDQQKIALQVTPDGYPDTDIPEHALGFRVQNYGIRKHWQLFSSRQLMAMTTFSDLIRDVATDINTDALQAGLSVNEANDYANSIVTFLALALDRCADFNNSLCRWKPSGQQSMQLFGRQVIPMVWNYCEPNILGEKAVCWKTAVNICADAIETIPIRGITIGNAEQIDASGTWNNVNGLLVSTDPPYYDMVGYAVLSDFFYAWLRRTIGDRYPDLFNTIVVPKAQELTASSERFDGNKERAKAHFESGFRKAFTTLRDKMDVRFPLTVYYAFKQSDESIGDDDNGTDGNETSNNRIDSTTGWETLLEALLGSGFQITATWPIQASQKWRLRAMDSNALGSYIVLACRVRSDDAPQCTRREFLTALKKELLPALTALQQGNIMPADLDQAAIGPGMAVFSRYAKVVESNGKPMTVRMALALINQTLGEVQVEQEAEYDADTRWALAWFEQHGFEEGEFAEAEQRSRAKNTAINGLVDAGIVASGGGKVRLLKREELQENWDPTTDKRLTVWEATQHLIRALNQQGETGAACLLRKMSGQLSESARELAYRLHKVCESNGWSAEAQAYNSIVLVWPELTKQAQSQEQFEFKYSS